MKTSEQGFSLIITFILVAIVAVMGLTGYFVLAKQEKPRDNHTDKISVNESSTRDETRQRHAIALASRLFSASNISKLDMPISQVGLEIINPENEEETLNDPLTGKPYSFKFDQDAMEAGEVTFRLNATCDNKISGSASKGYFQSSSTNSVAVAIKLENEGFACESSL